MATPKVEFKKEGNTSKFIYTDSSGNANYAAKVPAAQKDNINSVLYFDIEDKGFKVSGTDTEKYYLRALDNIPEDDRPEFLKIIYTFGIPTTYPILGWGEHLWGTDTSYFKENSAEMAVTGNLTGFVPEVKTDNNNILFTHINYNLIYTNIKNGVIWPVIADTDREIALHYRRGSWFISINPAASPISWSQLTDGDSPLKSPFLLLGLCGGGGGGGSSNDEMQYISGNIDGSGGGGGGGASVLLLLNGAINADITKNYTYFIIKIGVGGRGGLSNKTTGGLGKDGDPGHASSIACYATDELDKIDTNTDDCIFTIAVNGGGGGQSGDYNGRRTESDPYTPHGGNGGDISQSTLSLHKKNFYILLSKKGGNGGQGSAGTDNITSKPGNNLQATSSNLYELLSDAKKLNFPVGDHRGDRVSVGWGHGLNGYNNSTDGHFAGGGGGGNAFYVNQPTSPSAFGYGAGGNGAKVYDTNNSDNSEDGDDGAPGCLIIYKNYLTT